MKKNKLCTLSSEKDFLSISYIFIFFFIFEVIFCRQHNTWEPEKNLDCPDLIEEFEKNQPQDIPRFVKLGGDLETISRNADNVKKFKTNLSKSSGFQRGLKAEKIVGASIMAEELIFLIKWLVKL